MEMNLQTSIMYGFLMFIIMLGGYAYSEHTQKVSCQDKARLANSMAIEAKKRYDMDIGSYEYAIKEITSYYNETIADIDNFKKDNNETECEASYRILRTFKY